MAAHARLKNEFTEDEKYHNLMRWLNSSSDIRIFSLIMIIMLSNDKARYALKLLPWLLLVQGQMPLITKTTDQCDRGLT